MYGLANRFVLATNPPFCSSVRVNLCIHFGAFMPTCLSMSVLAERGSYLGASRTSAYTKVLEVPLNIAAWQPN